MTDKAEVHDKEEYESIKHIKKVKEPKLNRIKGFVKNNYKVCLITAGTFVVGYGAGKLVEHELVKHYGTEEEQEDEANEEV